MKYIKSKCFAGLLIAMATFGVQAKPDVDLLLEQARIRLEAEDTEGAAAAYHKVLQLDDKNAEARRGLAEALVKGHVKDPHSEQADVLNPLLEEKEGSVL